MNFNTRCFYAVMLIGLVPAVFGIGIAGADGADVEIVAQPKTGKGPMWVHLEPRVKKLGEPMKFHWYFGDGEESTATVPKPHYYEFGKYNLLLEVTDKEGKVHTASINIDATLPG